MYGFTQQTETEDGVEMQFYNSDIDGFARWLLYSGYHVRVIHPAALSLRLAEMVRQLSAWYV